MTSVEKLEIKLLGLISFDSEELRAKYKEAIKQAKEMEIEQKGYSEIEVELITYEMVNWAIDNIGNISVQSGKKFDEVLNKFKNK